MPYYSLEAWVYQATHHAIALCEKHHAGKDAGEFERWAKARASLDEVIKPKEATCLRDHHNPELAAK